MGSQRRQLIHLLLESFLVFEESSQVHLNLILLWLNCSSSIHLLSVLLPRPLTFLTPLFLICSACQYHSLSVVHRISIVLSKEIYQMGHAEFHLVKTNNHYKKRMMILSYITLHI